MNEKIDKPIWRGITGETTWFDRWGMIVLLAAALLLVVAIVFLGVWIGERGSDDCGPAGDGANAGQALNCP